MSQLLVAAGKLAGSLLTCTVSFVKTTDSDQPPLSTHYTNSAQPTDLAQSTDPLQPPDSDSSQPRIHCGPTQLVCGAHSSRQVTGLAWVSTSLPLQQLQSQPDAPAVSKDHLSDSAIDDEGAQQHATSQHHAGQPAHAAADHASDAKHEPGDTSHTQHAQQAQQHADVSMSGANIVLRPANQEQGSSDSALDTVMHDVIQSAHDSAPQQHMEPQVTGASNAQPADDSTPQLPSAVEAAEEADQSHGLAAHPLLISSGADGQVKLWQHTPEGLLQQPCPKAWSSPSLEKDKAFQPLGVAVSGNGLLLAVAVDNGTSASAAVQ